MAITQDTRRLKVSSSLGDDVLILTSLNALERISGLFELDCTFVSEREDVNFDDIIGQGVGLELEMAGGEERYFHGVVASFSQADAPGSNVVYQARLVPWLWFLTRSADCRIFQNKSVVDIIKEVFDDHKLSDYKLDKLGSYDPIPYCVQYRETDFNFVSRLMEDWGIGYFFSHSADAHEMVLFDENAGIEECAGQPKASYESDVGDANTAGQVLEWNVQQEFRTGAYKLTDYNYEDPSLDLGVEKTTQQVVGGNDRFEVYDYPGDYAALKPGDKRTQLRMEAEECASKRIDGSGTCYGFCPGYKFDLVGHYRSDYDAAYLITEVRHTFCQVVGKGMETSSYENSFACVPHAVPYRPPQLTPKPVIHGVQTAVVTGAEGKEVDVDPEGRIVVQFHWDRKGEKDEKSSCRVRVAQAWAGKEWGAYFIPRIGQEVMVEFEEGDPDRPIVTGRVYNGEQKPPYTNGEHSGIKTRSTQKGESGNFNEIRFEDAKGSERLFIQAERNQDIVVKVDKGESVGGNETISVGADRTESVGANETLSVGASRSRSVGTMETITIAAARTLNVGVNDMTNVGAAQEVTVGGAQAITVGAAQVTSVGAKRSVNVGGDQTENVGGNFTVKAGGNLQISADGDVTLKSGGGKLVLKKNGDILLQGKKIQIKGDGDVVVKGSKISEN